MKTLFDLWYRELEQGRYWSIRYFDNLVWMLGGRDPEQGSMGGRCGFQDLEVEQIQHRLDDHAAANPAHSAYNAGPQRHKKK